MHASALVELKGVPANWSNQRLHHLARHSAMDAWKQMAHMAAQGARNTARWPLPVKVDPPAPRWLEVTLYRHHLLDEDNLVSSLKPIIDGLKGALLVDDSPAWCRLIMPEQVKVPITEPERTVIRVSVLQPVRKEATP